jgi:uncharacterized glyoxalase superfamily protein PhnB
MQAVKATNFFPVLTTTKLTECRDFYTQYFGFTAVFEADWYIHLASEVGIQLGFLQPNHPTQPDFLHAAYGGNGVIYSFEVNDVDQEYEKIKKSGAPILLEVKTEEWGQRHFMIKDPSGMTIDIVQHAEPTDEYKEKYSS